MNEQQKTKLLDYVEKIQQWARDRGIDTGSTVLDQISKFKEENGEIVSALNKSNKLLLADGIGDSFVCLVNVALISDVDRELLVDIDISSYEEESARDKNLSCWLLSTCEFHIYESAYKLSDTPAKSCIENYRTELTSEIVNSVNALFAIAEANNLDFIQCIDTAWNEIKYRKGRMIDGKFVKEE